MTVVVDASTVVAALVDGARDGDWADELLASDALAAPHLLPGEVANILRRASLAGEIAEDVAALAHGDLPELRVDLFPRRAFRRARVGAQGERHLVRWVVRRPRRAPRRAARDFRREARRRRGTALCLPRSTGLSPIAANRRVTFRLPPLSRDRQGMRVEPEPAATHYRDVLRFVRCRVPSAADADDVT